MTSDAKWYVIMTLGILSATERQQSGRCAWRLCGAAAPGALARTGRASDLDMRCGALPSLSAVVVLSLTLPRQSQRERLYRHLTLLCVFRTHRMCVLNGVFKRRTPDRMRDRERASSPRSLCFLLTSNCFVTV